MSIAEYGDITPRQLMIVVEEYNERRQQQREQALTPAYMAAYWQRVRRPPSLKKVLQDARPKVVKPQSPEQMLAFAMQFNARMTGREG